MRDGNAEEHEEPLDPRQRRLVRKETVESQFDGLLRINRSRSRVRRYDTAATSPFGSVIGRLNTLSQVASLTGRLVISFSSLNRPCRWMGMG